MIELISKGLRYSIALRETYLQHIYGITSGSVLPGNRSREELNSGKRLPGKKLQSIFSAKIIREEIDKYYA